MESLPVEHNQDEIIIKCSLEEMAKAFFKDYEIIWHDPNVNSEENQQYMAQLEKLCKIKTFTEWKKAEDYIKIAKTICHVITSGTNGELFVKEIFSSANVPHILTFCRDNKDNHSIWAKNYEKVLCTETKIEDVISQIQKNLREWQKQVSSLRFDLPAFAPIFDDYDKSTMNHLHFYLKVIPNFKNYIQARNDYLNLSKVVYIDEENKQFIAQFERTYDEYNKEAILKWYTRQSFVYKVINNCLRIATSDSIQYCRFLLKDIDEAIKDQYQAKSKNFSGALYRGAYLSAEEWSSLKANVNKEIEMHGFLSVSKSKDIALEFLGKDFSKKVFITIIVPKGPNEEKQGFAEVEEFSEHPREQEVLFNVRSRFTVLETEDEFSKDLPSRHLVLLYGAQGLRKFVAEKNHPHPVEGIKNMSGSRCQGPPSEMTEQMLFKSLRDPTKTVYSCKGCLDPKLGPFLCFHHKEKMPTTIKGCLLTNSIQAQIPLYGYQCSKCGLKNQKGYFVCTDCSENKTKWCENCFENSLSCIESGHSVLLETSPFSFWSEKMLKKEFNHLTFQNDIVTHSHHELQQGQMFFDTHEYEKAIKYYSLYISQNERDDKKLMVSYALNNLGSVYEQQGEYKKAIEYYLKSLEILKLVHDGDNHPDAATPYHNIGLVFQNQGEHQKALESYLKSVEILKSVHGEVHRDVAISYDNIGAIYNAQAKYNKALEYHLKALKINKSVLQENHPNLAYSFSNLGSIYEKLGKYNDALELYYKSLDIRKLIHGENHPTIATSYDQIGIIYRIQGEYKEAIEYHLKALNLYKSGYGENHPDVATSYRNIGAVLADQGEDEQALAYHLKSLEINKLVFGENHPDVADSYSNIGKVLEKQGEYEKALEYHFMSLKIIKSLHGENHPNVAISYSKIGSVFNSQGDFKTALEYHLKALTIHKSACGENHPDVATSYSKIGLILEDLGEPEEALRYHLNSVSIFISVHGEAHPDIATCYRNIAMFLENQGKYKDALEFHLKSLYIFTLVYGEVHFHVATSYSDIADVLENQEEYDKALENYFKSLDIFKSVRGEISYEVADSYNNIGLVYQKKKEYQNALDYFFTSLTSYPGEIHSGVACTYFNIAWLYQNQGKYENALPYHFKSLHIRKLLYDKKPADVAVSYEKIGLCYESLGEYKYAYDCYLESFKVYKSVYGEDDPETAILQDRIRKVAPRI